MMETQVKLPPHDIEAEEAVLGAIMVDPDVIGALAGILEPQDFYREKNRWTYEACLSLYKRQVPTDQLTVATELSSQIVDIGGASYLSYLINKVPTSVYAEHYANIVCRFSVFRQLISASNKIAAIGYDAPVEVDEALDKARQALERIQPRGTKKLLNARQYADRMEKYIGKMRSRDTIAVNFEIPKLDKLTGGLYPGEYTILGARPGMGKSTLLKQLFYTMAKKHHVLFIQAEMSETQNIERDLASEVGVPVVRVRQGNYSDDMAADMVYSGAHYAEMNFHYYIDGRVTTPVIRQIATRLKKECDLKVIFVDYLQVLKDKPTVNESYERISYISSELLAICNDLDVAMIVACQLSRKLEERHDKRPMLADLRDSGKIEENADNVFFLYRADGYVKHDKEDKGKAELIIAKHRQGAEIGSIPLVWLTQSQRYGELAY